MRREYLRAEDPPFWPRGVRFCDSASITSLADGKTYVNWPARKSRAVVAIEGKRYFHPVSACLDSMLAIVNGDAERAHSVARWMHSHARGGWLTYDFDWEWPEGHEIEAPWYSAMAQGVAISMCSHLGMREWSDEAFATLVDLQRTDGWLLEDPAGPDVLNGHIFATFGLYDSWRLSGKGEAEALAAIRTVAERLPEWLRVGKVSRYAGSYPAYGIYHGLHVMLLHRLADITDQGCSSRAAEAFASDVDSAS